MTNDTGSPLALIAAILERHDSNLQSVSLVDRPAPAFDPQFLRHSHELPPPQATVVQRVSSWGLPDYVSAEVTTFLSEELSKYQTFVQSTRAEILEQLINTTLAGDPSIIPSLVESTCDVVYRSAVDNMLSRVQRQVESFSLNGVDIESGDDSGSESASEDESEDGDDDDMPGDVEGEEDNAPMRPGEEVPPLETKYLPIFEALHERGKVLTKPEKTYLVNMTGMTYRQITIWFQNRRRGELKESMNMVISYSKASSTHSDESSESEQGLEKKLGAYPPNTTFDIRSWRLQSALATKDDNRGSIPPLSPLKYNLTSTANISDTESDTDPSDDSDDNISVPPGLQAPSLTTSITTADSITTNNTSASIAKGPAFQLPAATRDMLFAPKEVAHTRPIRGLPPSRRDSPSAQQTQHRYSHFLESQNPTPLYQPHQSGDAALSPSQCVTSNECGLTVNLAVTPQLRTSTLTSSPVSVPIPPLNTFVSGTPSISPSPSARSPQRQPSPTSSTSPRPHIKPLPRRTGCAPRPRPPPRSGPSTSTPTPAIAPGSSRPSVVLPPSSNPSLGSTTLGALLRPNPPAPAVPQEIEERLTAMAGRMGVGANTGSSSSARQSISSNAPRGGAPGSSAFPGRSTLFSFGPTSLPRTSIPSGVRPVLDQTTQGLTGVPPSS